MQRIDHPSNVGAPPAPLTTVSPGYFRRPSVVLGDQGTVLTEDFANDLQEAIMAVIEHAGTAYAKGQGDDLLDAIRAVIAADVPAATAGIAGRVALAGYLEVIAGINATKAVTPASLLTGTTTGRGLVEFATVAETLAGSDAGRACTPAGIAGTKSLAVPGYYALPGGLLLQWGTATVSGPAFHEMDLTLPVAYSSVASYVALATYSVSSLIEASGFYVAPLSATQIHIWAYGTSCPLQWLTVGY